MIIDIEPQVLPADEITKLAMEIYGYKRMLCFLTKTGIEFTVKWNENPDSEWSIEKFCPRMTVSEMKQAWEAGFDDQVKKYEKALHQNRHPYWILNIEHRMPLIMSNGKRRPDTRYNGKYGKVVIGDSRRGEKENAILFERLVPIKAPLTENQRKIYQKEIDRIKSLLQGELTFVAYVNNGDLSRV